MSLEMTVLLFCTAVWASAQNALAGGGTFVTLAALTLAPRGLDFSGSFICNVSWTLLDTPCVNVPGFTGPMPCWSA